MLRQSSTSSYTQGQYCGLKMATGLLITDVLRALAQNETNVSMHQATCLLPEVSHPSPTCLLGVLWDTGM